MELVMYLLSLLLAAGGGALVVHFLVSGSQRRLRAEAKRLARELTAAMELREDERVEDEVGELLKREAHELGAEVERLRGEVEGHRVAAERSGRDSGRLRAELAKVREQLRAASSATTSSTGVGGEEVSKLRAKLADTENLASMLKLDVQQVKSELAAAHTRENTKEREIERLRTKVAGAQRLEIEGRELRATVKELESAIVEVRSELEGRGAEVERERALRLSSEARQRELEGELAEARAELEDGEGERPRSEKPEGKGRKTPASVFDVVASSKAASVFERASSRVFERPVGRTPFAPEPRPEPASEPGSTVASPLVAEVRAEGKLREPPEPAPPSAGLTVADVLDSDPTLKSGQRETIRMIYGRFAPKVRPNPSAEVREGMTVGDVIDTDPNLGRGQREAIRTMYNSFGVHRRKASD